MVNDDKKIVTSPDKDHTRAFRIMLVDFEWGDIQDICETLKSLDGPVTIFLYGSNDNDPGWCIEQHWQCHGVLLNMRNFGKCELLKGYLLGNSNVYTYGKFPLEDFFPRGVIDIYTMIGVLYQSYINDKKS